MYSSPAVADVPGLGPTVFIGSYDGRFYAYTADGGAVRWSHGGGGRIDGSAAVVGNVVYYGGQVFSFHDGEFTPVITDGKVVFLIGYATIYQMVPKH